jgi:multiple sugar transport system permease protein
MSRAWRIVHGVLALAIALYALIPLAWLFLASFKTNEAVMALPIEYWPREPTLSAYAELFAEGSQARQLLDWPGLFANSLLIAGASTLLVVVIATIAGYAFARLRFPGQDLILAFLLVSRMFQGASLLLPTFRLVTALGLYDTPWGLVVIYSAFGVPFATWIIASGMREIPAELDEAAMMDGCSRLGVLRRVILPLSQPALVTAAMWHFVGAWSEFAFASVLIESVENKTVTLGLVAFLDYFTLEFNRVGAASALVALPILGIFLLGQRYFVRGLLAGAVKG